MSRKKYGSRGIETIVLSEAAGIGKASFTKKNIMIRNYSIPNILSIHP